MAAEGPALHDLRTEDDEILGTFSGQVPRAGDVVWLLPAEKYEPSAYEVTQVCWWLPIGLEHLRQSKACVYVRPIGGGE